MRFRWAVSLLVLALLPRPAAAVRLAGVQVPDRVVVEDTALVLNGAGVRRYFLLPVYIGALYLPQRINALNEILRTPAPKCIALYLLREVTAEQAIADLLAPFRANASPAAYAQLRERLDRFSGALPNLRAGDIVRIELREAQRTDVWLGGSLLTTIAGRDFQAAVLKLWLGDYPTDERLKRAMLGNGRG